MFDSVNNERFLYESYYQLPKEKNTEIIMDQQENELSNYYYMESDQGLTRKDIKVVVEINNYNNKSPNQSFSPAASSNLNDNNKTATTTIGNKPKIVAKIKPNRRHSSNTIITAGIAESSAPEKSAAATNIITTTNSSTPTATTTIISPAGSSSSQHQPPPSPALPSLKKTGALTIAAGIGSSSLNLGGGASPVFESGVNTECIQILRQLWNIHEDLVQFHQDLLFILNKCQQSVQYTIELDSPDTSSTNNVASVSGSGNQSTSNSKKFKNVAFITALINSNRKRKDHKKSGRPSSASTSSSIHYHETLIYSVDIDKVIPTFDGEDGEDSSAAAFSAIDEDTQTLFALKQMISCPIVDSVIQRLKSLTENVNEIERQYNLISLCQSQCKLVLYAKVRHAKKYVIHDRLTVLYTIHRLILTMMQLLSSTTFWELFSIETISTHFVNIFQLTEVYNNGLETTYESSNACAIFTFNSATFTVASPQQPLQISTTIDSNIAGTSSSSTAPEKVSSLSPTATTSSSAAIVAASAEEIPSEMTKINILAQILEVSKNDSPSCRLSLKPLSATKLLQLFAQKRASFTAYKFISTIQSTFNILGPNSHRIVPKPPTTPTPSSSSAGITDSISSAVITTDQQETMIILSLDKFETCYSDEDLKLNVLSKCFSKCPSLLGNGAIKRTESGQERLSGSVKNKMYNYFRQILWTLIGEISEDLILWDYYIIGGIPLVFCTLDVFNSFKNSLLIGKKLADKSNNNYGKMTTKGQQQQPIILAIDSIINSLNSFILLTSWDEKIQLGFEMTIKIKRPEQVSLVRNPTSDGIWATKIGAIFGEIVTTCLVLMEECSYHTNDVNIDNISSSAAVVPSTSKKSTTGDHQLKNTSLQLGSHNTNQRRYSKSSSISNLHEEELLTDEAQILFRLDATLTYYKAWIVKRCKSWLNSWAMPVFIACSQRDSTILLQLVKSYQTMFITREIFLTNPSVSIKLSAKHRKTCAEDLQDTLTKFQKMPEDLLLATGPVGRMLALATIQSYMPNPLHWRGVGPNSGLNPDKASPYVHTVIGKVIEPVTMASVEYVSSSVQEAIGKQVIQATCEAWQEYILQKKIKFSEWGALQLLRDFMTLRDWIRNESLLDQEARKALLQLEILKRCEGVAFLLLRSPGDVLGVGKPSRKTRRVAPTTTAGTSSSFPTANLNTSAGSTQSSPSSAVSDNSTIADDIPPEMYVPNQQIWLDLRLRRNILPPCCQLK